jgi:1,4-dihydroxy-2-naphthoyl-CoA hydrolase
MGGEDSIKDPGRAAAVTSGVPQSNFDVHLGTEWLRLDPEDARARVLLTDDLRQPYGIMHGGVYSSLVESLCSYATAVAVYEDGMITMGQSIEVSFLRPVTAGHAEARAVVRHRGRSTWVWEAEVLDDDEKLCALAKMTMAVRPAPPAS